MAQGLTVDHAFVLAGPGLTAESGYTALSRGRQSNRLYTARDPDLPRSEFAPADPHRSDPIARLCDQLGTSSANTLAIDTGGSGADPHAHAQHVHAVALARRRAAETSRVRWLPGRRRQLEQLRSAETEAAYRVEAIRCEARELRHGTQPFTTERDVAARFDKTADLFVERRLEREQGRDVNRGLER